ncbi:hypothetical protein F4860DRAFT_520329 [Xylaria cubensis]|nr:hypothetical protein F4860DRAFT_520329 [Xylaria cubensis]
MAPDESLNEIDPWNTPLWPPPPGVIPNFVDPVSRAPVIREGIYSILAIMIVFVLLRLYSRTRLARCFGWDDYLCIISAACIFIIAYSGVVLSFIGNPEGRHGWDIPLAVVSVDHTWLNSTFASLLLYTTAYMFTKITLLVLYLRLFETRFGARFAIWLGIIVTILFYTSTFFAYIGLCARAGMPIWESIREPHCSNGNLAISKAQGWYSLISDTYILIIPISPVWRLTLNLKRKLGVMAIFLTGLGATIISAVALSKRYESVKDGAERTWTNSIVFLYVTLEVAIGLICGCMPVIASLLKDVLVGINSMWISVRRYSSDLLTRTSSRDTKNTDQQASNEKLPDIPRGTITGIRTLIRKVYHFDSQNTNDSNDIVTTETLRAADEDYHEQLKKACTPHTQV